MPENKKLSRLTPIRLVPQSVAIALLLVILAASHMDIRTVESFDPFYAGRLFSIGQWFTAWQHTDAVLVSPVLVLILALCEWLTLPTIKLMVGLSIAAIGVGSWLVYLIVLQETDSPLQSSLSSIIYLLSPSLWLTLGQVDSIAFALALAVIFFWQRDYRPTATVALALGIGFHFLLILLPVGYAIATTIRNEGKFTRLNLLLVIVALGWVLLWFGAKANPVQLTQPSILEAIAALSMQTTLWVVLLCVALVGLLFVRQLSTVLLGFLSWAVMLTLLEAVLQSSFATVALTTVVSIMAAYGSDWISEQLSGVPTWVFSTAMICVCLAAGWQSHSLINEGAPLPSENQSQVLLPDRGWDSHREAGYWLKNNTPENATFVAENIAIVGYFSERRPAAAGAESDYSVVLTSEASWPSLSDYVPILRIIEPTYVDSPITIYRLQKSNSEISYQNYTASS